MANVRTETCHYCGGEYPYPVSLHHHEDECRPMPTDHDSIVAALRREAFVAFRIKQGYANRIDSWHAGEIAFNAGWATGVESLVTENARLRSEVWKEHVPCTGTQHDPLNGLIHGYCVRCRTPWPCEWSPERALKGDD